VFPGDIDTVLIQAQWDALVRAEVRRPVQLELNRGESRHALARWLFIANQGEFHAGDYEEIMNKATCLSLLSNAVLVWNTARRGCYRALQFQDALCRTQFHASLLQP
jgi:hypothetical protein